MDLHVEAEGWLESRGEDLHLLCLRQVAGPREERLESLLEVDDGRRALACHQFS